MNKITGSVGSDPAAQAFYDAQYQGEQYAAYTSPDQHPFYSELKNLLAKSGNIHGRWLEVGCGRGLLQDVVENYTGVDISSSAGGFLCVRV